LKKMISEHVEKYDPVVVFRELDDSWRHGCYVTEVFKINDKFYEVDYRKSEDGEYNGLHEGEFEVIEVEPVTETRVVTTYKAKK